MNCPIVKNYNRFTSCFLFALFVSSFFVFNAFALTVGSNTSPSREPFTTFPAADTNNLITGFAWLSNGFELENATASCTFDAAYPVSGELNLNGGTLYLTEDLVLTNPMDLQGLGTIIGNNHKLILPSTVSALPADAVLFQDIQLYTSADIDLQSIVTFQGNCMITTQGNIIDLSNGGITVGSGSTLKLQHVRLEGVGNNNIQCSDNTANLILDNVLWCQIGDTSFSQGSMLLQNHVSFIGSATFNYASAMTSTIDDESTWRFDGGINFVIGRQSPDVEPLYFVNPQSVVVLGECTMITTFGGIGLTRGRLEFEKNVTLESQATGKQYGTVIGDGVNAENDFTIYCGPGSDVVYTSGWLTYNNVANDLFYSASPTARFTRMGPSSFFIQRDCVFPECILNLAVTSQFPTTVVAPGAKLYYNNAKIMIANSAGSIDGYRTSDSAVVLGGNDSLDIEYGQFIPPVVVTGQNNSIVGSGSINAPITLTDSTAQLAIALQGGIYSNINLNGGTLILLSNLLFGNTYEFQQGGTINLMQYCLTYGHQDMVHTATINWLATNGDISMQANMTLTAPWTINGNIMIHGNGNTITLAPSGSITIMPNAHLTLKDVIINGINNTNIQCTDNTGALTLDNVSWVQNGNCTYNYGTLEIQGTVNMAGSGMTFAYNSAQNCLIGADAVLALGYNVSFNYNPASGMPQLIVFGNQNSAISLTNATFSVAATGLQLTGGRIIVDQNSNIYSAGNGITFGDDFGDDCPLVLQNGTQLTVLNGPFNWRNTTGIGSQFAQNSNITMGGGSSLCLYENIYLNGGTVSFDGGSALLQAPGKQISGSVHALGSFSTGSL